jgi:3-hydroxyisobutyrate dehydrogenase/glyoxylate/succinic semialdehyde reductase
MRIAFLGLGIMGSRMARRLVRAGHDLVLHNRSRERADRLLEQGASWADSPAAAAADAEILITMLTTPDVVRATALGKEGFLDALPTGVLWMDCSTVDPFSARAMAAEATTRGVRFLDAPVAGSKQPAEDGQLLFLVGGEAADVEVCRPLFEVMGRAHLHAGPHGQGAAMKMVVNLLLGYAMLSFSEGLVLGRALGLDERMLLDTLPGLPVTAPFAGLKTKKIEADDYAPEFPLQWMRKDLHLAADCAYRCGVSLPALNVAKEVYGLAEYRGWAAQDMSAVHAYLSKLRPPSGD